MVKKLTNMLVQLPPDVVINGYQAHPHSIELFITFPEGPCICPDCGSLHCNVKGSAYRQTVCHVPSGGIAVLLTFSKRRYVCLDCGHSYIHNKLFVAYVKILYLVLDKYGIII